MFSRFTALLPTPVWISIPCSLILIGLISFFALAGSSAALAQDEAAFVQEVRVFDSDNTGELHPAGLAFAPRANSFLVLEAAGPAQPPSLVSDILKISPGEERAGTVAIAAVMADPINMAFDSKANRLLLFDALSQELIEIKANTDGSLASETLTRHNAQPWSLQIPQGMSVDPASGELFILDSAGPRLVRVKPETNGSFDQVTISTVDLQPTGLVDPRGLALDPTTGHLHVVYPAQQTLYELTQGGQVVARRDLSSFEPGDLQGIVFAPSGDLTDDPLQMNLYLADTNSQPSALVSGPSAPTGNQIYLPLVTGGSGDGGNGIEQTPGRIVELSFVKPMVAAAASTFTSSLVRTVNLANISPPSPDPSGIAYLPNSNSLMVSDGEVEETVNKITHFQGANVWELTLSGSVIRTANISKKAPTVVPMTNEPTGVAWNPINGHYFFSDDYCKCVYDLDPGADGLVGTADDSWTSFSTIANGNNNNDVEGITFGYNDGQPRLWVADGVNREVYEYTLSGSLVSHFDVLQYGVEDPESVEYNPDSGTLFVMSSNRPSPLIAHTTLFGNLIQMINISASNPQQAAGIAYAPASNGSGAKRLYIVDRGIDNNSDPRIVDGKMYEMTAPSTSTPVNEPPVANDDSASTSVDTALTVDVTANDTDPDGNLNRSSAAVITPPSNGTLVNNGDGSFTYTPAAGFNGTDAFTYQVCDTGTPPLCDSATVTITVNPPGADLIFADGFESGNLSAWSASVIDSGDLSVSTAAKLVGNNGMQAVIDDNNSIFVTDDTANAEPRYRARFYFDPNSIPMVSGDTHAIFYGYSDTSIGVLRVQLRFYNGAYQIRAALLNDATTWKNSSWFMISDATHFVELDWQAATAAGANDGHLTLWIDGTQKASLTNVDNDTRRIDSIRLGAVAAIDTGTRGTYYFDAFESRRLTYIGPDPTAQVASAAATALDSAEDESWTEEEAVPKENGAYQLFLPRID